jgi:hypothetical protein
VRGAVVGSTDADQARRPRAPLSIFAQGKPDHFPVEQTMSQLRAFYESVVQKFEGIAGPTTGTVATADPDDTVDLGTCEPADEPASAGDAPAGPPPGAPADGHTSRNSFVKSEVKENSVATAIIDKIYPYFPTKYQCISAYLSKDDLYWKVNYHWDAMRVWLEYAKGHAEMDADEQKQLADYYTSLMSNQPSTLGHYKVNKIGEPADTSDEATIEKRCGTLQTLKKALDAYSAQHKFHDKNMEQKELLKYALNPLAMPKKSNHIHGWALDIAGDIQGAAAIATKLGATLAFQEMTHCHCEFENGVRLPT